MDKKRLAYKKIISICISILFIVSIIIFLVFDDFTFSKKMELIKYATILIVAGPAIIAKKYYY
ncbi:MAG: hypothetical protein ACRC76_01120 [Proteocatella sp.]